MTFVAGHADTHSHSLDDLRPGLLIITGIVIFLVVDKAMRAAMGGSGTAAHSHGHGHGSHSDNSTNEQQSSTDPTNAKDGKERQSRSPSVSITPGSHEMTKAVAKSCAHF